LNNKSEPLQNVRVLDLSRILAGPVCCQVLADLGADVVKVERPGTGDDTRQWGPPFTKDGTSAYYLSANRGKRSLALNLAHTAGRDVLDDLIRQADVLVENFLPDSLDKFGLRPQRLGSLNPRLVSCSISGFGRTGPWASVPGYDLAIQATSGLMSITGEPDGMPMKVGVAVTDVIAGLYAATSVLAGLHGRTQSGSGEHFDLALLDCTLASLVNIAQAALVTGWRPERYGNAHPHIVPYEAFATSDGHLVLAVGNDRQWQRFCSTAGRDDWLENADFATNPGRVAHRDLLVPQLQALFAGRKTDEWIALLTAADVPHAPVLGVDEALSLPQTVARGMVVELRDAEGGVRRLIGSPLHREGAAASRAKAPPALGQHTFEVLRDWLAYDADKLNRLRSSGAIG